ncbi:hypothetical protein [Bosea sp. RAC05]|uniref:hypothetical protein n=1 Tax=Bosea sp. RAC05 TaxID=1842539 RepID=UPI001F2F81EA|nr:hypothetical protein [Bosea sp. RAC05]
MSSGINLGSIAAMNRHSPNESKVDFWSGQQIAQWADHIFDGAAGDPGLPAGALAEMIDSCGLAFKELTSFEGNASVGVVFDPLARIDHPGRATVRVSSLLRILEQQGLSSDLDAIAQRVRDDTRRDLRVVREPLGFVELLFRDKCVSGIRLHWVGNARDEWILPSGAIESQPSDSVSATLLHDVVVSACRLPPDQTRFADLAQAMESEGCLLDSISVMLDGDEIGLPKCHFVSSAGNAEELLRSSFEAIGRESARDFALTIAALIMSQPDAVVEHAAVTLGSMNTVEVCVGLDAITDHDEVVKFVLQMCWAFGRPELEERIRRLGQQLKDTGGRFARIGFELATIGRPFVTFNLRPAGANASQV